MVMFGLGRIYYPSRLISMRTYLNRRIKNKGNQGLPCKKSRTGKASKNHSLLIKKELQPGDIGLHVAKAYQLYAQKV